MHGSGMHATRRGLAEWSKANHSCVGQILKILTISESVFQVAACDSRVFTRECFRPRTFAIRDRIHDRAMLVRGDEEQFSKMRGYILPFQESARRGKRERTGLANRATQHAAVRQVQQRPVKARIELDVP